MKRQTFLYHLKLLVLLTIPTYAKAKVSLEFSSFSDIIKNYTIVADFNTKEPERRVSKKKFWKYPYIIPKAEFPIDFSAGIKKSWLPATRGSGRFYEHLNRGRLFFMQGNFLEAKKTWLSAKARFNNKKQTHQSRLDFFIGLAFLRLGESSLKESNYAWEKDDVKTLFANTSTFLSLSLLKNKNFTDPFITKHYPATMYVLATIYYRYQRFAASFSTAKKSLEYLLETGRNDYRFQFRRIIAESWIRNRSYLTAVRVLDTAIRQDPEPYQVALSFGRIGDIYFALNNYELAHNMYGLSESILRKLGKKNDLQTLLRGEALFWNGKFKESQKALWWGINSAYSTNENQAQISKYIPWASLRLADAYLARKSANKNQKDLNNAVELAYFKVLHYYAKSEAAKIAKVRLHCLQEKNLKGFNIKHFRDSLRKVSTSSLPKRIKEIASSCLATSFISREKGEKMIGHVKEFYKKHPSSTLKNKFIKPILKERQGYLDKLILKGNSHAAIKYFEDNKKAFFKNISTFQNDGLFRAYIDVFDAKPAKTFFKRFTPKSSLDWLRVIVFIAETEQPFQKATQLKARNKLSKENIIKSNTSLSLIERIMLTAAYPLHINWIIKTLETWSQKSQDILCEDYYTALSKGYQNKNVSKKLVSKFIRRSITNNFPELISKNSFCAESFLTLESLISKKNPLAYAKQWLKRLDWPTNESTLNLTWDSSELLFSKGEFSLAQKLREHLTKNLPKDSPILKMIQVRNTPLNSEYEKLWQK